MYVKYAGIILSDLFDVVNHETSLLPSRENVSIDIFSRQGQIYNGFKYGTRKIKITFLVKSENPYEYSQYVNDIAAAFDVDAPSRLYLGDESKYYYAVPDGEVKISVIGASADKIVGEGEVTLICYDPMAYSDEYKMFTGTNRVTVTNEGTTETYPIIKANFTKPAAFVQVSDESSSKSVLVGKYPMAGNNTAQEKTINLNDTCETTTDWLAAGNVVDSDRIVEGAITINSGGYAIKASNFGTTNDQKWHGPAFRRNIGANISDFEVIATFEHDSKGKNVSNAANNSKLWFKC